METSEGKSIERKSPSDNEFDGKSDPSNISPKKTVQLGVVSSQEGGKVSSGNFSKKSRWDQAPDLEEDSQPTILEGSQDDQNFPNVKNLIQKFEETSNSSSETSRPIVSESGNTEKPARVKLVRTNFMSSVKEKSIEKENTQFDSSQGQEHTDEKEPNEETQLKNESFDSSEVKPVTSSKALQIISSYYDSPTDESSQEAESLSVSEPTTPKISQKAEAIGNSVTVSTKEEFVSQDEVLDVKAEKSGPNATAGNIDRLKDSENAFISVTIDEPFSEHLEEDANNASFVESSSTLLSSDAKEEIAKEEIAKETGLESFKTNEDLEMTSLKTSQENDMLLVVKETETLEEELKDEIVQSVCIHDKPANDRVVVTAKDLEGYHDTQINVEKDKYSAVTTNITKPNTSSGMETVGGGIRESGNKIEVSCETAEEKEPVKEKLCAKKFMYVTGDGLDNPASSNVAIDNSGASLRGQPMDECNKKLEGSKLSDNNSSFEEKRSHLDDKVELTLEKLSTQSSEELESSTNVAPLQDVVPQTEDKVIFYDDTVDATMEEIFLEDSKDASDIKDDVALPNEPSVDKIMESNSNISEESDRKESKPAKEQSSQGLLDILETTGFDISTKEEKPSSTSNLEEISSISDYGYKNLKEDGFETKDNAKFVESPDNLNVKQINQVLEDSENVETDIITEAKLLKPSLDGDSCNVETSLGIKEVSAKIQHKSKITDSVEPTIKANIEEPAESVLNESTPDSESSVFVAKDLDLIKEDTDFKSALGDKEKIPTQDADDSRNISIEVTAAKSQELEDDLDLDRKESDTNTKVERNKEDIVDTERLVEEPKEPVEGKNIQIGEDILLEPEEISNETEKSKQEETSTRTVRAKEIVQVVETDIAQQEFFNESKSTISQETTVSNIKDEQKSDLSKTQTDEKSSEIPVEAFEERHIIKKFEDKVSIPGFSTIDAVITKDRIEPSSTDETIETIEAIDSFLNESDEVQKNTSKSSKLSVEESLNNDEIKEVAEPEKALLESVQPQVTTDKDFVEESAIKELTAASTLKSEVTTKTSLKTKSVVQETFQSAETVDTDNVNEHLESQLKDLDSIQRPESNVFPKVETYKNENLSAKRTITETDIADEEVRKKTKAVHDSSLGQTPGSGQLGSKEQESPTESNLSKQGNQEDSPDKISSQADNVEQDLTESEVNIVASEVLQLDTTVSSDTETKLTEKFSSKVPKLENISRLKDQVTKDQLKSVDSAQQVKSLEDNIITSSENNLKFEIADKETQNSDLTKSILDKPVEDSHELSSTSTDQTSSSNLVVKNNQPIECPTEIKPVKGMEPITRADKSKTIDDSLESEVVSSISHVPGHMEPVAQTQLTKNILTSENKLQNEFKDIPISTVKSSSGSQPKTPKVISETKPVLTDKEINESKPATKSKIIIKRPVQTSTKIKPAVLLNETKSSETSPPEGSESKVENKPILVESTTETTSEKGLSLGKVESETKTKVTLSSKVESPNTSVEEPTKPTTETTITTEKPGNEKKPETKTRIVIKRPTQISTKNQVSISSTETKPAKAIATVENISKLELKDEPKPMSTDVTTSKVHSSTENQTKLIEPISETEPAKQSPTSETDLETKSTNTVKGSKEKLQEPTKHKLTSEKSINENAPETKSKITIKRPIQISSQVEPSKLSNETKPVTTTIAEEVKSEIKSKNEEISTVSPKLPENTTVTDSSPETVVSQPQPVEKVVAQESTAKAKPVKEAPPVTPVRVSARQKQRQAAAAAAQLGKSPPESASKKALGIEKVGDKRAKKSLSPMKEIHIKIPSGKAVENKQSPPVVIPQKSPKTPVSPVVHGKLEPITLKLSKEENPVIVRSSSLSPKKILSPHSPQTKTLGYTLKIGKDSTTIIPKDPSLSPKVRDSSPSTSGSKSEAFGKVEYLIKDTGLTITPVSSIESQEQKLNKITLKLSKAGGHPEIKQEKNESWKAIQKLGEVDITPVEGKPSLDISKRKDKTDEPSSEKKPKLSNITVEPSTSSGPSKLQGLLTQAPLNQSESSGSGNFAGIGQQSSKDQTAGPVYEIGLLKPEEAPIVRKRGRPRKISSPDDLSSPITHSLTAKNILAASLQHQTLQQQIQIQQLQQQQAMAAMMQQQEDDDGSIPMFQCPLFDLSDPMDSFMEPHPTIFPEQVQPVQEPILRSARGRPIGRSRRSRGAGIPRGLERGGPRGRPRGSRGIKRMLEEMESLSYPDMEQPITLDNIDSEIPRIMEPVMATETTIALLRKSIEIKKENKARKPEEPESLHSDLEAKVREMKEKIEAAYKAELKSPGKTTPEKDLKKKKIEEKSPEKIETKKGLPELIPLQKKDDKSNESPRKSLDSPRKSLESPRKSSDSPKKPSESPKKSSDSPRKSTDSQRKSLDGEKQKRLSTDEKDVDSLQGTGKQASKRKMSQDMGGQEKSKRKSTEEKSEPSKQEGEDSQESKPDEDMDVEQASSQDSIEAEEVKTEPEPPPKPVRPRPKSKAEMKRIKREKDRLRREAKKLAALEALKAPPPNPNEEDTRMSASDPNGDGTDGIKKSRGMEVGDPEGKEFTVQDIAEYQWPLQGGELYMIQEQISTYLAVKSFKRKYPDLRRRTVEMEERTYLCDSGLVAESMCDLGLTAVSSSEVLDVLFQDFPEKYEELRKVMREKAAQELINKQKERKKFEQSLSKSDLKEHAIQSALNWNQSLNRSRTDTRKCHLDLQTWTIQYPRSRGAKMSKPAPRPGNYPVAVIPGQYTDYYKRYTPQELRYWPVNTVLYGPLQPNERNSTVNGSEGSQSESDDSSSSDDSSDSSSEGEGTEEEKERGRAECRACAARKDGKPCAQCARNSSTATVWA